MDIAERKNQLRKLAALDSAKATQYLESLSRDLVKEIKQSNENNYIAERLDLLAEFAFRVPEQALEVSRFVIDIKPKETRPVKSRYTAFDGITHVDLILKAIELLNCLRYIEPDNVLSLASELTLSKQKEIHDEALKLIQEYTSYDPRIIKQIGYSAQQKITDFIAAWSIEERIRHIDFVEAAAEHLLSSSVMSSEMTAVDKLTLTYGQVVPTELLKKIRQEVMNVILELFKAASEPKLKLRLVKVLDNVTQLPHNVKADSEVSKMITQDSLYLVGIYRQMVQAGILAVTSHIEQQLYWMNRGETCKTLESIKLRDDIMADSFYQIFDLLVGDRMIRHLEEGGWEKSEREHAQRVSTLIESINKKNLGKLSKQLNNIADQQNLIESWRYASFDDFLIQLSETKPLEADLLFEDAFARQLPLRSFVFGFLFGLRIKNEFKRWDKYTKKIVGLQQVEYVVPLIRSLCLPKGIDLLKAIRENDLDIIGAAVNRNGPLYFIKGIDDPRLHFTILETILRCFSRAPKRMQSLLIIEINTYPRNLSGAISQLHLAIARDWIHISELSSDTLHFIASKLIEVPDLNWEMQELLLQIGQHEGCRIVLDLIMKRIRFYDGRYKELFPKHYEPIPFHMNPQLQQFIGEDAEYKRIMVEWLGSITDEWSIYNIEVSQLLHSIKHSYDEILMSLIEKGNDTSLKRATMIMHSIEGSSIKLSIEIARRTNNEDILEQVFSNLLSTGVVSGEYGIAIAYENKAKELEQYKDDSDEGVRKFVASSIQKLKEMAKHERQRAEESMEIRRIQFEG